MFEVLVSVLKTDPLYPDNGDVLTKLNENKDGDIELKKLQRMHYSNSNVHVLLTLEHVY